MELIVATNNEVNALHLKFKKFNVHLLEDPSELYDFIGIMDVFNRALNEEEASELLGRSHNRKHSAQFVSTFTNLFHVGEKEVYVQINKKAVGKDKLKYILGCLNRKEANFFRKWFSNNRGICKISDEEALVFLTKLAVNELYFADFFFPSLDTVIVGNYDLSFPVYAKKVTGFNKCKEVIEKNGLFIR